MHRAALRMPYALPYSAYRRDEESSLPFPRRERLRAARRAQSTGVRDSAMELALKGTHLVAEDNSLDALSSSQRPHETTIARTRQSPRHTRERTTSRC